MSQADKKQIACLLSKEDYGVLSLWCTVNSFNRSAIISTKAKEWLDTLEVKALVRRLKLHYSLEWQKYIAVHPAKNYAEEKEILKNFKKDKRIDLRARGIISEIVSEALNW